MYYPTMIYASENIDAVLLERGYPQIVLDSMHKDTKSKIYEENLSFAGANLTYYEEETNSFTDINVDENGNYIQPRNQISTKKLSLSITYSAKRNSNGTLKYLLVTYDYNWLVLPVFRWQDTLSVSWDGDKFEMEDDSFYKVDYADGAYSDGTGKLYYVNELVHSEERGYANGSPNGVSWYADLKGYTGLTITDLYGYAMFRLEPKATTSTGSMKIYGHYVHPTIGISPTVNIKGYGSISASGGFGYDERGFQKTIKW